MATPTYMTRDCHMDQATHSHGSEAEQVMEEAPRPPAVLETSDVVDDENSSDESEMDPAYFDGLFGDLKYFQSEKKEEKVVVDEDDVWASQAAARIDEDAIFEVGDDVWESNSFQEFREVHWSCFDYDFQDYFYRLPNSYFEEKGLVDPRAEEYNGIKSGFLLGGLDPRLTCSDFTKRAVKYAKFALAFYNNKRKKDAKETYQFAKLSMISHGLSFRATPIGRTFFITFTAIENGSGCHRDLQANVFYSWEDSSWNLRAFRPKPCTTPEVGSSMDKAE